MKCFYHNDIDGKCAGAIVYKWYLVDWKIFTKDDCEFISIDYKDDFPFEKISPKELVVIVDFSLQKEGEFEKLLNITDNVIWIDHHKTSIEKHKDVSVRGLRVDGTAGCELTWEYFYPGIAVPPVVALLGDYDVWSFRYGEETNKLQAGVNLYDIKPNSNEWIKWLNPNYSPTKEIREGEIALRYRNNYYEGLIESCSYLTEFEGHVAIACNAGSVSSKLFDSVTEDYDLMMPFVWDGHQWRVSIYTKKDIDVSEIAKKYGGGGHKQAAGFQCKELPF